MSGPRELDLVLVGATGFVGRLTAKHLAQHAPPGVRIALAGRSLTRLRRLSRELEGAARDWPLIAVDTTDRSEERRVGKECRSRWSPYH